MSLSSSRQLPEKGLELVDAEIAVSAGVWTDQLTNSNERRRAGDDGVDGPAAVV